MNITRKTTVGSAFVAIILALSFVLVGCDSNETKVAKENFNNEVSRIQEEFDSLQSEINNAEELVLIKDKALDESLRQELEDAISDAKTIEFEKPSLPSNEAEKINDTTEELKNFNFTSTIESLQNEETALSESIEKYKLVTNPSEAFVIERLRNVEGVGTISAVTEDNDPNGLLNKVGGYTATVYFSSPWVNQNEVYGSTVIDKGTDGGGAIEVYASEGDALDRNSYLGAFDGPGFMRPGSHTVIGTVVVRTSDKLTATQQKQLEAALIEALTKLPTSE